MSWVAFEIFIDAFGTQDEAFKYADTCKTIEKDLLFLICSDVVICPHCENSKYYITNRGYKCAKCLKKFGVRTILGLGSSKITFPELIKLAYMVLKRESSLYASKELGLSQKTTYKTMLLIRSMWDNGESILKSRNISEFNKATILTKVLKQKIKEHGEQTDRFE